MKTLFQRVNERFTHNGVFPTPELLNYVLRCDQFAAHQVTHDEVQVALCGYLDQSAIRIRALSEALGRIKEPPHAEVVTESINMLVDSIVRRCGGSEDIKVFSERNIKLPQGGYRKPDIGLWKGDRLTLMVECKTSLGHKRESWLEEYETRVKEFEQLGVHSDNILLFVESEHTWRGFPREDPRYLKNWFALAPKGAWHGSGKDGSVTLMNKNHTGIIKKFSDKVEDLLNK